MAASGAHERAHEVFLMNQPAPPPPAPRAPRECRVVSVEHLTADAVSILLEDVAGEPFTFDPGQFFMVTVEIDGQPVRRTYSATSAPGEFGGRLRLGVKRRPGGLVSNYLNDHLKPGDRLMLKGPGGRFVPSRCGKPHHLVLIAGGSGVTPMMSMVRAMLEHDCSVKISLIYANRALSDIMYGDELDVLSASYAGRLLVLHVLTDPPDGWTGLTGRLDAHALSAILETLPPGDEYLVCGAPGMMQSVSESLLSLGIAPGNVRTETFNVPEDL